MDDAVLVIGGGDHDWPAGWQPCGLDLGAVRCTGRLQVVILLDHAIHALVPADVLLRIPAVALVLCPEHAPYEVVTAWALMGASCVTQRADLDRIVALLRQRFAVAIPAVALAEWCRVLPAPGSAMWLLLQLVSSLDDPHRVAGWARLAGMPRQKLHDICRGELGATPREILWWCTEARFRRGRELGMTFAAIARDIGYHDAAGLHHAMTRRRRPPPPPSAQESESSGVPEDPAE